MQTNPLKLLGILPTFVPMAHGMGWSTNIGDRQVRWAIKSIFTVVSMTALAILCPHASGSIIAVDHYDTGWTYNQSMAWTISGAEAGGGKMIQAMPFVAPATGPVDVWLTLAWQTGARNATVEIRPDASGEPGLGAPSGAYFFSDSDLPSMSDPHPLTPIHITTGFELAAGQTYWVKVMPNHDTGEADDAVILWYWNKLGHKDLRAVAASSSGPWTVYSDQTQSVFRVDVVPEPATLSLLAIGGLCIAWRLARRRVRAT